MPCTRHLDHTPLSRAFAPSRYYSIVTLSTVRLDFRRQQVENSFQNNGRHRHRRLGSVKYSVPEHTSCDTTILCAWAGGASNHPGCEACRQPADIYGRERGGERERKRQKTRESEGERERENDKDERDGDHTALMFAGHHLTGTGTRVLEKAGLNIPVIAWLGLLGFGGHREASAKFAEVEKCTSGGTAVFRLKCSTLSVSWTSCVSEP